MTSTSEDPVLVAIAQRIRGLRDQLTQAQFAEQLGIASKTVIRWEQAHAIPDGDSLLALWQRFGADPGWVLTGEGAPPPLAARESLLIDHYRAASTAGKKALDAMAETLASGERPFHDPGAARQNYDSKGRVVVHGTVGQAAGRDMTIHHAPAKHRRKP